MMLEFVTGFSVGTAIISLILWLRASRDTERLDWLDAQGRYVTRPHWEIFGKNIECQTIRLAIDEAMKEKSF